MPANDPASTRYRVLAVEPDARLRTRMTLELAGIASAPCVDFAGLEAELAAGGPSVVVFGASLATDDGFAAAQRLQRDFPESGIVLLAEELTLPLLQSSLRAGIRDAVALGGGETTIRQAIERVGSGLAADANRAAAEAESAAPGQVIVAFSTKGGVGKSVVASNLSVLLAGRDPDRVALVDADLQFGDVAVLLGIPPLNTTTDATAAAETADAELMEGLLARHEASTLRVLCAPVEPAAGDRITPEEMIAIVRQLRRMFDFVVIDMPPHFDDVVLALIEEADHVLLVASMDIPSIKNLKVGIQTLDLLSLAGSKLNLVLNRANAKVHLDIADVERALGVNAEYRIPSDISVPQAVNRGIPVVLDKPRSPAAVALSELADSLYASHPGLGAAGGAPESTATPEKKRRRRR